MKITKLYWSQQGKIGCELLGHAPYPGSDSWANDHWRRVPARLVGKVREVCPLCGADREPAPAGQARVAGEVRACTRCGQASASMTITVQCETCAARARRVGAA